jgi:putative sterol carrier protein
MSDNADTETDDQSAQPVAAAQFLSEFEVSLPPLGGEEGGDLEASFSRLADLIGAPEAPLSIVIHLADESEMRSRAIHAAGSGCKVTDVVPESPDVELILDTPTWRAIASGELSLLAAFARGRMRVRGDINDARRLVQQLRIGTSAT